jgi:methionyl-tRNA formyltransferase
MAKIKTLFFGTSEFAIPVLEGLLELEQIDLIAVLTQPDKPVGRKHEMQFPVIKKYVIDNNLNIEILQPESVRKSANEILEKYEPELIIVASYGQIISKKILHYPKFGCLNLHGSLLPELRGAVPAQMAILQGLKETGVTLQKMDMKMDEGDIISTRKLNIPDSYTSEDLLSSLSILAKEIIIEDLPRWLNSELQAIPQDHSLATYCYKEDLAKENAEIKLDMNVQQVDRMIRAFCPWPIAWLVLSESVHAGKRLKIFKAAIADKDLDTSKSVTNPLFKESGKLYLKLSDGVLELQEVQLEGKSKMSGKDYLFLVT